MGSRFGLLGLTLYTVRWYAVYSMKKEDVKNELREKYPILKFAGILKGSKDDCDNDKIDEFLYDVELRNNH